MLVTVAIWSEGEVHIPSSLAVNTLSLIGADDDLQTGLDIFTIFGRVLRTLARVAPSSKTNMASASPVSVCPWHTAAVLCESCVTGSTSLG